MRRLMSDPNPTPANPWMTPQRWFVIALIVLFIVLSIQYTIKVFEHRSAFIRWREQVLELSNENIYDRYVYPNPPIMALVLKPLADIEPGYVGALLWFYLKVGMALAALYWVFRLVEGGGIPFPPWAKALVVLLSLRPIMGDLIHGNVNLFILFLVMAALYALHRGRQAGGGLLLALAIACKVTPALFVPYLAWKRAWRALAGCAVGLFLFLWAVPSCFLGWEKNQELLTSWTNHMIVPFLVHGEVTSSHENQSLPGAAARLLTHSPSFLDYDPVWPHAPRPQRYDNLLDLPSKSVNWLVKGVELLFVGLVVWRCRRSPAPRAGWRRAAEFSLIVLGMLLFSERTWKHHCVTLMLPFAVLCYYLSAGRPGRGLKYYLIGTLAAVTLLMASTSSVSSERVGAAHLAQSWEAVSKTAQVYGAYVWAYFLLLAALVVVLGRREERAAGTAADPELVPLALPVLSRRAG
jgi:alpha-1,2-mannosyltransferase